jgi:formylmethanofuran dehydrogenase subunit C
MSAIAPLIFTAKDTLPAQRVDLSALTPQRLAGLTLKEINALALPCGKARLNVADVFTVQGEDATNIFIKGAVSRFDRIGAAMSGGVLTVEGDAGAYLGQGMTGGLMIAKGSVGIFAGAQMRGGAIDVSGDAGDFLGAAVPGEMQGLAGGQVRVRGNAGHRAGDRMRRGAILIEGWVGDYAGSRMLAGTVVALKGCGAHPGYGMRRGTLIFPALSPVPATFNGGDKQTFGVLTLLFRSLQKLGGGFAQLPTEPVSVQRYLGDRSGDGRGEIIVAPLAG